MLLRKYTSTRWISRADVVEEGRRVSFHVWTEYRWRWHWEVCRARSGRGMEGIKRRGCRVKEAKERTKRWRLVWGAKLLRERVEHV